MCSRQWWSPDNDSRDIWSRNIFLTYTFHDTICLTVVCSNPFFVNLFCMSWNFKNVFSPQNCSVPCFRLCMSTLLSYIPSSPDITWTITSRHFFVFLIRILDVTVIPLFSPFPDTRVRTRLRPVYGHVIPCHQKDYKGRGRTNPGQLSGVTVGKWKTEKLSFSETRAEIFL